MIVHSQGVGGEVGAHSGRHLDHLEPGPLRLSLGRPERLQALLEHVAGLADGEAAHLAAHAAARHEAVRVDQCVVGLHRDCAQGHAQLPGTDLGHLDDGETRSYSDDGTLMSTWLAHDVRKNEDGGNLFVMNTL